MTGGLYPKRENSWNCFGCVCVCPNSNYTLFSVLVSQLGSAEYAKWIHSLPERMQITPIFPGFDRALHVQPNLV